MRFDVTWSQKPLPGKSIIYRYFDIESGRSYIGRTVQSLKQRAGGKFGSRYLKEESKFGWAIMELGFDFFQYEILEVVEQKEAKARKGYYIEKFNSKKDGYNGKRSNEYIIHLADFSKEQKEDMYHNFALLVGGMPDTVKNIDQALSFFANSDETVNYWYYAFEGDSFVVTLNPILLFANFFDLMYNGKFVSMDEMRECLLEEDVLGGDFLTSGDYDRVKIELSNGKGITLKLSYKSRYE